MKADANKRISLSMFDRGVPLIIIGLAKKILIADNMAVLVGMVLKDPFSYGSIELWLTAYAFAFQIYFDFSGYTDIARGSAMLFGYDIPINFNMPYIARNMSDFWHRWHISLSTWLRDYLFIPLGGSRGSRWQTNRNLFLTMALGGLWHGAAWNFVVWGVFHGLSLIIHREFSLWRERTGFLTRFFQGHIWKFASILVTFHVVCIGWVFFRVENIGTAFGIVKRMLIWKSAFSPGLAHDFIIMKPQLPVIVPVALIMLAILLAQNVPVSALNQRNFFTKLPAPVKALFCSALIIAMVTFLPDSSEPFIYFQF